MFKNIKFRLFPSEKELIATNASKNIEKWIKRRLYTSRRKLYQTLKLEKLIDCFLKSHEIESSSTGTDITPLNLSFAMQALVQFSINFSGLNKPHNELYKKQSFYKLKCSQPIKYCSVPGAKTVSFHGNRCKLGAFGEKLSFLGADRGKDGILLVGAKRVVAVRFNQGFNGFNGGGSGRDNGNTSRVLGNLALAILLTYLSMTGQLGWVLDAIVSLWVLAVVIPIVGFGAFLWWAGRDMVQGACPNCGNEFQVLKSTLDQELQLCPFCSQPFSVVGNEFVSDPIKFSNQARKFDQSFNDSSSRKGKVSSTAIVDVEAEIRDAD